MDKEEIEKAKDNLRAYIDLVLSKNYCECNELNVISNGKYCEGSKNVAEAIETLLQYKDQLEQENRQLKIAYKLMENEAMKDGLEERKKQNKIIDEMAGYIATLDIDEDICSKTQNKHCDKRSLGECESCIKQYFEKKVDEVNG